MLKDHIEFREITSGIAIGFVWNRGAQMVKNMENETDSGIL